MKDECSAVREELQNALDVDRSLPVGIRRHLSECPECRSFHASLLAYGRQLREALDSELASWEVPDLSKLQRNRKKTLQRAFPWVAAVLTLAIISGWGLSRRSHSLTFLEEENQVFVNELFERGLFEVSVDPNSPEPSSWWLPVETLPESF